MRHAMARGEWKFTEFRFLIVDFFHLSFACRYCGRFFSKFDRHPPLVPPFYRSLSFFFFASPTQWNDKQLTNPILPFGRVEKTSLSFKGEHPLFMVIVEPNFLFLSKPSKTIIFLWAEISVSDVTEKTTARLGRVMGTDTCVLATRWRNEMSWNVFPLLNESEQPSANENNVLNYCCCRCHWARTFFLSNFPFCSSLLWFWWLTIVCCCGTASFCFNSLRHDVPKIRRSTWVQLPKNGCTQKMDEPKNHNE